jgi:hypothetical protein
MRIPTYIPIKALMKVAGLSNTEYVPVEQKGLLYVDPLPIAMSEDGSRSGFFPFQYNPEKIVVGGRAIYEEHGAKGVRQFLEYVNSSLDEFPLQFTIVNDVRSQQDNNRARLFGHTEDELTGDINQRRTVPSIRDLLYMFKMLTVPDIITNTPPNVRVSFGNWFIFRGKTLDYSITVTSTYKDLTPKIVEVSLTLKGDYGVV